MDWIRFLFGAGALAAGITIASAQAASPGPGQAAVHDAFVRSLSSSDSNIRYETVLLLAQSPQPDAIGVILIALEDENPNVQLYALSTLLNKGPHAVAEMLSSQDVEIRKRAVRFLGMCQCEPPIAPLLAALSDTEPGVRQLAARALGEISDPDTKPDVASAVNDTNAAVSDEARKALAMIDRSTHRDEDGDDAHAITFENNTDSSLNMKILSTRNGADTSLSVNEISVDRLLVIPKMEKRRALVKIGTNTVLLYRVGSREQEYRYGITRLPVPLNSIIASLTIENTNVGVNQETLRALYDQIHIKPRTRSVKLENRSERDLQIIVRRHYPEHTLETLDPGNIGDIIRNLKDPKDFGKVPRTSTLPTYKRRKIDAGFKIDEIFELGESDSQEFDILEGSFYELWIQDKRSSLLKDPSTAIVIPENVGGVIDTMVLRDINNLGIRRIENNKKDMQRSTDGNVIIDDEEFTSSWGWDSLSRLEPKRIPILFDNQSGTFAFVKLIGPTARRLDVPNGTTQTVKVSGGSYELLVRYEASASNYRYFRGQKIYLHTRGGVRITLHAVKDGNYSIGPASEDEFRKAYR